MEKGEVVVVTGASMGIGEALAKTFVQHGARVVLLSRETSRAEAARARIPRPEQTLALACDVRQPEEIERVISLTLEHFGHIDVWINNAGHGLMDAVAHMDEGACRDLFDTNLFGAIAGMQAIIPVMQRQGAGTIINISSVAGHIPLPYSAAYSASKFAMNALGKAARVELRQHNINVLTVCPGYVRTDFAANATRGREPKRVRPASIGGITADRVARATLEAHRKRKREVVVPWTMIPVIKLYQLFPGVVERAMSRMARAAG